MQFFFPGEPGCTLEGEISIGEILLGLFFNFSVRFNPFQKFGAVSGVFSVSSLISLKGVVVSKLFFLCCFIISR